VIADTVGDTACTFLAGLYRAEQAIADRLIRIVNGRLPWPWIDEEKAVRWVEKRSGLQLADSQRATIRLDEGAGDHRRAGQEQTGHWEIIVSMAFSKLSRSIQKPASAAVGENLTRSARSRRQ
jgi:hypothetical protein